MTEALICLGVFAGMLELGRRNLKLALVAFCGILPLYLIRTAVPLPGLGELPTTALEAAFLAIASVWIWRRGRTAEAWQPIRAWSGPIALFIAGALIGTLMSPDIRAALGLLRAFFLEPIFFFAIFLDLTRTREDARQPLTGLALSLIGIGLIAVVQKITGYGIPNPAWQMAETRRVTAFYGFPNAIGLFAAPLVVLFVGQAWRYVSSNRPRQAFLPSLAAALGALGLIFAVSQGAMLGAGCGLFLLGVTNRRLRLPSLLLAAGALSVILGITSLRTKAVSLVTLADDSGSVRQIIWGETMKMLGDHPIFGTGLAGFQHWYAPYHKATHIEIFMYPHMLPLNFWVEIGLIGFFGFIWTIGRFARLAVRNWRRDGFWIAGAATCAMVALLVHGLVDVPYFKNDLAILFWIIVALGTIGSNSGNDSLEKLKK